LGNKKYTPILIYITLSNIEKIGGYVKVTGGILVDLYVIYSYCKIKPTDFKINMGGTGVGVGMGYSFLFPPFLRL
jgi:hypothetical protein